MNSPLLKEMNGEFLRFLLVGAVQTLLTYLLFLLLLMVLPYPAAYSISFCCGIVLSYFLNVLFVFREKTSLASFLKFPLVYLIQYLLGIVLLWLLVDHIGIPPKWAMLAVIALTVPVTFLTSRFVIKKKPC